MNKLGVLGGMGPLATMIFCEEVINFNNASNDQENINMVILNDTDIPDRTSYLIDKSKKNPFPYLLSDIKTLETTGCSIIAMPCNTAHYYYDDLVKYTQIPIINMVDKTLKECQARGFHRVGLLATKGTILTGVYEKYNKYGLSIFVPDNDYQEKIEVLIYDYVKKNRIVPQKKFISILEYFVKNDVDGIILGCTELSVINHYLDLNKFNIVDSTIVLAKYVNEKCVG